MHACDNADRLCTVEKSPVVGFKNDASIGAKCKNDYSINSVQNPIRADKVSPSVRGGNKVDSKVDFLNLFFVRHSCAEEAKKAAQVLQGHPAYWLFKGVLEFNVSQDKKNESLHTTNTPASPRLRNRTRCAEHVSKWYSELADQSTPLSKYIKNMGPMERAEYLARGGPALLSLNKQRVFSDGEDCGDVPSRVFNKEIGCLGSATLAELTSTDLMTDKSVSTQAVQFCIPDVNDSVKKKSMILVLEHWQRKLETAEARLNSEEFLISAFRRWSAYHPNGRYAALWVVRQILRWSCRARWSLFRYTALRAKFLLSPAYAYFDSDCLKSLPAISSQLLTECREIFRSRSSNISFVIPKTENRHEIIPAIVLGRPAQTSQQLLLALSGCNGETEAMEKSRAKKCSTNLSLTTLSEQLIKTIFQIDTYVIQQRDRVEAAMHASKGQQFKRPQSKIEKRAVSPVDLFMNLVLNRERDSVAAARNEPVRSYAPSPRPDHFATEMTPVIDTLLQHLLSFMIQYIVLQKSQDDGDSKEKSTDQFGFVTLREIVVSIFADVNFSASAVDEILIKNTFLDNAPPISSRSSLGRFSTSENSVEGSANKKKGKMSHEQDVKGKRDVVAKITNCHLESIKSAFKVAPEYFEENPFTLLPTGINEEREVYARCGIQDRTVTAELRGITRRSRHLMSLCGHCDFGRFQSFDDISVKSLRLREKCMNSAEVKKEISKLFEYLVLLDKRQQSDKALLDKLREFRFISAQQFSRVVIVVVDRAVRALAATLMGLIALLLHPQNDPERDAVALSYSTQYRDVGVFHQSTLAKVYSTSKPLSESFLPGWRWILGNPLTLSELWCFSSSDFDFDKNLFDGFDMRELSSLYFDSCYAYSFISPSSLLPVPSTLGVSLLQLVSGNSAFSFAKKVGDDMRVFKDGVSLHNLAACIMVLLDVCMLRVGATLSCSEVPPGASFEAKGLMKMPTLRDSEQLQNNVEGRETRLLASCAQIYKEFYRKPPLYVISSPDSRNLVQTPRVEELVIHLDLSPFTYKNEIAYVTVNLCEGELREETFDSLLDCFQDSFSIAVSKLRKSFCEKKEKLFEGTGGSAELANERRKIEALFRHAPSVSECYSVFKQVWETEIVRGFTKLLSCQSAVCTLEPVKGEIKIAEWESAYCYTCGKYTGPLFARHVDCLEYGSALSPLSKSKFWVVKGIQHESDGLRCVVQGRDLIRDDPRMRFFPFRVRRLGENLVDRQLCFFCIARYLSEYLFGALSAAALASITSQQNESGCGAVPRATADRGGIFALNNGNEGSGLRDGYKGKAIESKKNGKNTGILKDSHSREEDSLRQDTRNSDLLTESKTNENMDSNDSKLLSEKESGEDKSYNTNLDATEGLEKYRKDGLDIGHSEQNSRRESSSSLVDKNRDHPENVSGQVHEASDKAGVMGKDLKSQSEAFVTDRSDQNNDKKTANQETKGKIKDDNEVLLNEIDFRDVEAGATDLQKQNKDESISLDATGYGVEDVKKPTDNSDASAHRDLNNVDETKNVPGAFKKSTDNKNRNDLPFSELSTAKKSLNSLGTDLVVEALVDTENEERDNIICEENAARLSCINGENKPGFGPGSEQLICESLSSLNKNNNAARLDHATQEAEKNLASLLMSGASTEAINEAQRRVKALHALAETADLRQNNKNRGKEGENFALEQSFSGSFSGSEGAGSPNFGNQHRLTTDGFKRSLLGTENADLSIETVALKTASDGSSGNAGSLNESDDACLLEKRFRRCVVACEKRMRGKFDNLTETRNKELKGISDDYIRGLNSVIPSENLRAACELGFGDKEPMSYLVNGAEAHIKRRNKTFITDFLCSIVPIASDCSAEDITGACSLLYPGYCAVPFYFAGKPIRFAENTIVAAILHAYSACLRGVHVPGGNRQAGIDFAASPSARLLTAFRYHISTSLLTEEIERLMLTAALSASSALTGSVTEGIYNCLFSYATCVCGSGRVLEDEFASELCLTQRVAVARLFREVHLVLRQAWMRCRSAFPAQVGVNLKRIEKNVRGPDSENVSGELSTLDDEAGDGIKALETGRSLWHARLTLMESYVGSLSQLVGPLNGTRKTPLFGFLIRPFNFSPGQFLSGFSVLDSIFISARESLFALLTEYASRISGKTESCNREGHKQIYKRTILRLALRESEWLLKELYGSWSSIALRKCLEAVSKVEAVSSDFKFEAETTVESAVLRRRSTELSDDFELEDKLVAAYSALVQARSVLIHQRAILNARNRVESFFNQYGFAGDLKKECDFVRESVNTLSSISEEKFVSNLQETKTEIAASLPVPELEALRLTNKDSAARLLRSILHFQKHTFGNYETQAKNDINYSVSHFLKYSSRARPELAHKAKMSLESIQATDGACTEYFMRLGCLARDLILLGHVREVQALLHHGSYPSSGLNRLVPFFYWPRWIMAAREESSAKMRAYSVIGDFTPFSRVFPRGNRPKDTYITGAVLDAMLSLSESENNSFKNITSSFNWTLSEVADEIALCWSHIDEKGSDQLFLSKIYYAALFAVTEVVSADVNNSRACDSVNLLTSLSELTQGLCYGPMCSLLSILREAGDVANMIFMRMDRVADERIVGFCAEECPNGSKTCELLFTGVQLALLSLGHPLSSRQIPMHYSAYRHCGVESRHERNKLQSSDCLREADPPEIKIIVEAAFSAWGCRVAEKINDGGSAAGLIDSFDCSTAANAGLDTIESVATLLRSVVLMAQMLYFFYYKSRASGSYLRLTLFPLPTFESCWESLSSSTIMHRFFEEICSGVLAISELQRREALRHTVHDDYYEKRCLGFFLEQCRRGAQETVSRTCDLLKVGDDKDECNAGAITIFPTSWLEKESGSTESYSTCPTSSAKEVVLLSDLQNSSAAPINEDFAGTRTPSNRPKYKRDERAGISVASAPENCLDSRSSERKAIHGREGDSEISQHALVDYSGRSQMGYFAKLGGSEAGPLEAKLSVDQKDVTGNFLEGSTGTAPEKGIGSLSASTNFFPDRFIRSPQRGRTGVPARWRAVEKSPNSLSFVCECLRVYSLDNSTADYDIANYSPYACISSDEEA